MMPNHPHSLAEQTDDIRRLKSVLQLTDLNYVDISAQNALQQALQRWPLLAELSTRQSTASAAAHALEQVE